MMKQHIMRNLLGRAAWLIIPLYLVGCSSVHEVGTDGPPTQRVDISRIPEPIPKHEYQSPSTNPHSYKVRGKRYYVLKSNKGYHERGLASWYGTKFHKKKTSTGDQYNMFEFTAASKKLRIPSYVEVTNLRNGRKIIAKVHDRGPFVKNRLIDLSYVAALKLDIVKHGTAMVDVKVIDPETYYSTLAKQQKSDAFKINREDSFSPSNGFNGNVMSASTTTQMGNNGNVFVQVGAFSNRDNADKLKLRLQNVVDQPVSVEAIRVAFSKPPTYRVKIGPMMDSNLGYKTVKKLSGIGLKAIIKVIN